MKARGLCATSSAPLDDLNININGPLPTRWPSAKTLFVLLQHREPQCQGRISKMPLVPKKRPKRAPVSNMLLVPKILLAIMAGGVFAAAVAQLPILLK